MFERYTEHARRALFFARYAVSQHRQRTIELEHLLLGVIREPDGFARALLINANVPLDQLWAALETHLVPEEYLPTTVEIPFSVETKRALEFAAEESDRLGHSYIGVEHLMLGILRDRTSRTALALEHHGMTLERARDAVVHMVE